MIVQVHLAELLQRAGGLNVEQRGMLLDLVWLTLELGEAPVEDYTALGRRLRVHHERARRIIRELIDHEMVVRQENDGDVRLVVASISELARRANTSSAWP